MLFKDQNSCFLEDTDRNKLYLIWLSHTNFDELKKQENLNLLQGTWQSVKFGLQNCFRDFKVSLDTIVKAFKKITLTTDPKIVFQYRPATDELVSNIATFFFSVIILRNRMYVSTIPWKLGALLVHEFNHYQIFKENNLVGKESEIEKFDKSNGIMIEKEALTSQIAFLENCKKNIPLSTIEYLIKVECWTADGKPMLDKTSSRKQVTKKEVVGHIDDEIDLLWVDANTEDLTKYQNKTKRNNLNINRMIRETIALPFIINEEKANYPEIVVSL